MFTKTTGEVFEPILEEEKIKETLSLIIRCNLNFVALGVVEKTQGKRFLVCESGFKHPLLKTPGGRPEIFDEIKENPLDTVAREIQEEIGAITCPPGISNIFLIQKKENRKGNYYYTIVFDLKYYSGEIKKGNEIAELKEFTKEEVSDLISLKKMEYLHIPIWKYYINNLWK